MRRSRPPTALTIAGSDSGGGAGISADLKTFSALGVHGLLAVTSITAQNTLKVKSTYDLPAKMVAEQIEVVVEDIGVDAAKTGMLSSPEIVRVVAESLSKYDFPLVVDPVMRAKSGDPLLKPEAVKVLAERLIPRATVVTPNRPEAEALTHVKIAGLDDAKKAAKLIVDELGAEAAVVKGGHIDGDEAVDVLYYAGSFREYRAPRLKTRCTHGTGCVFSAAIAAELAKGATIEDAVREAKRFTLNAITYGVEVGSGACPVNPTSNLEVDAERYRVIENVYRAVEIVEREGRLFSRYVPEVQMNVVMALPPAYARSISDVAGVQGRIVKWGDTVKASGPPRFGTSRHLARAVLKMMSYNPKLRSAINLRYAEELVGAARRLGFTVSWYDRREEPEDVKRMEGASIPWGIEVAVRRVGKAPDVIYHLGDWGKEPMINVFGKDAVDAVQKALRMIREAVELARR